jgi:hypothetical protein
MIQVEEKETIRRLYFVSGHQPGSMRLPAGSLATARLEEVCRQALISPRVLSGSYVNIMLVYVGGTKLFKLLA